MTLLQEIQEAAVDPKSDLGTLLRRCKLLAARLGSQPLEDWLLWESNGYPIEMDVPEYRVLSMELKGHFSGPFGSGIKNAPIPLSVLPEAIREKFSRFQCRQSVTTLEELVRGNDSGTLNISTGDLALALGMDVYDGYNCVQAKAELSTSSVIELLNAVRNRVLDFALALWKEEPNAGTTEDKKPQQIASAAVTQIFHTTVFGGTAQLVGTAHNSLVQIMKHDFSSVAAILSEHKVEPEDINDLREAIEDDPPPPAKGRFGPRVGRWIAKMMGKAADGSWEMSVGAAGNLLADALSRYYGS